MTEERGPEFALPTLYGAPAYTRPPTLIVDAARPIDPDDLPLERERTAEERALAARIGTPGDGHAASPSATTDGRRNGNGNGAGAYVPGLRSSADERRATAVRRFSLRTLAELFRDRERFANPGR